MTLAAGLSVNLQWERRVVVAASSEDSSRGWECEVSWDSAVRWLVTWVWAAASQASSCRPGAAGGKLVSDRTEETQQVQVETARAAYSQCSTVTYRVEYLRCGQAGPGGDLGQLARQAGQEGSQQGLEQNTTKLGGFTTLHLARLVRLLPAQPVQQLEGGRADGGGAVLLLTPLQAGEQQLGEGGEGGGGGAQQLRPHPGLQGGEESGEAGAHPKL